MYLEDIFNDILKSITFARLTIIHTLLITPKHLIDTLLEISQKPRQK